jgi:enoyl-CoA hydratase
MTGTPLVLRHDDGALTTLTLNRPDKLNALNVDLFSELRAHVDAIAQSEAIELVVLRGAGKCFSAGHDLADIATGEVLPAPHFQADCIEALAGLPQPLIVAVHGHCYTGALELALAGDIIVVARSARIADTHARFALTPVWGLSQRLPRRVGMSGALDLMFSCRTIDGTEAQALGLADHVFDDVGFDDALRAYCDAILANSSFSHRITKALVRAGDGLPLPAGLSHELHHSPGAGPDMAARIAAFTNRTRKPGQS